MTGPLRREIRLYFTAQTFLSRLPAPAWAGYRPGELGAASRYFPLVGAVLGGLAGLVWLGAVAATGLPALAAGLAIGALILLTGGLHEDGLADCCDGLGGARDKTRVLEIMRDSRVGAYGVIGLVVVIGLRWAALVEQPLTQGAVCIILAAMIGRAAMLIPMATLDYARTDGAARDASNGVGPADLTIAFAFTLAATALAAWLIGVIAFVALAASVVATLIWTRQLRRRLNGYTGDGLGAAEQIAHTTALIALASR